MPTAHAWAAAAAGADGRIYIAGTDNPNGTNVIEAYDPRSKTWDTGLPGFPTKRWQFGLGTASDGEIYVLGGIVNVPNNGPVITNIAEAYSPATNAWTPVMTLPSMGVRRCAFPALEGPDGLLYAIGGTISLNGQPDPGAVAGIDAFSPATGTWLGGDTPGSTVAPAAAVGGDGRIYCCGGSRQPRSLGLPPEPYSMMVLAYAPAPGAQWSGVSDMTIGRCNAAAAEGTDGLVYVCGGNSGSGTRFWLASVEAYVPATNTWIRIPSMLTPRASFATVQGADGRIYALGGIAPNGAALQTVEAYGPTFTLSPTSGAAGATVTVNGSNFGPSAAVTVYWGTVATGTQVGTGASDASGTITPAITFTVPGGTTSGTYPVTVVDNKSNFAVNALFVVH
jgi:hypothetical protein